MNKPYSLELFFLCLVMLISLVGFSSLFVGSDASITAYHVVHVITILGWLTLLAIQLFLIRQGRFDSHRIVGKTIFVAGPVLVATLTFLTVHSAAKDAALGRADFMVVQNVMVTLEVALLVLLAFALRRNRRIHGALLLSTGLLFMEIALFFALISYAPGFRASGPGAPPSFAAAGQTITWVGGGVALLFFFRNWRIGWPWLLAGSFAFVNGLLQMLLARSEGTKPLTLLVASIGRPSAFALGLLVFAVLLWLAWIAASPKRSLTARPG
ncbi:hypothetical protein [Arenimonas oryziterrae]|uniref:Uncharacterized protein n=1 Tax=Arenimonas oryziterrae DSM 21050 = YC6267 TaxID=1121015 RepID=A0A091AWJ8_9GAMM|nr:hypothetical protein [Arenimonas oryziterrae]KFN43019.1 hypothetical protein N789_10685 [Arenimonas oryziterrae DSM 21050 = YC6267]